MKIKPSSIRLRLLLSFTLVSSFAIIATLAASYSFNEVTQVMQSITTQRLPTAVSAGNLARSAERIVAIAPRLLNVQDTDEQADVREQLEIESASLNSLLAKLREKLATQDFETLSPAVATLQENLKELDAVVSVTLQLAQQRNDLLEQLEQDYVAFERSIAPRLLGAQARLQQLQNAADKHQSVNIFELAKATREVQPLQQLQLEIRTLRDSLLQIASEPEQSNLSLLIFPLERSRERTLNLLEQLPIDSMAALRPQVKLLFQYLSGSKAILGERSRELTVIESGHRFAEENKVLSDQLTVAIDNLVSNTLIKIDDANNEALEVQKKGQFFMFFVVILALACSLLIVWFYVDRRIVRRLQLLSDNMSTIAGGNLQEAIIDHSSDEIARMAHDLEVFRQTAIEVEQYNLDEINEARRQLNNAIESISEGFCLFDDNDRLILQNNHYRELFGLDDRHVGSHFETLLKRALDSRIYSDIDKDQYFQKRLKHHRNPKTPFVQQLQDGTWIRITERKTENHGTVAIYSDITEIKQHEQALSQAIIERDNTLGNLQAVMDAIDYGILFLDKDLNFSSANRAYYDIWNLDADEIQKAKNFRYIIRIDDDAVVRLPGEDFEEYVERRVTETKRGGINRIEVKTEKGRTILHQCVALADGSRMLAYFDITQIKQVEDELRQSRERYALALSGANEALWEWVPEDKEVYVSKRFHEFADISPDQERLTDKQWVSLVHPDDKAWVHEAMVRHMKDKNEFFDIEYRMRGPDKVYRWIQHRGAGLRREDGWIYRMAGSIGEIEARKALEFALRDAKDIAEQNSRFKSQFIANMSHELRTPLNAVIGITEMLREDVEEEGPEAFLEPLTRVSRAGKHLLNLINDVLDLSRIEAGKLALFPEHLEIDTLLNDAITTSQHLIQQNNNRIHLDVSEDVKSIYSDPLRFRQIVLNLLTNASKFTQNGDIYICAELVSTVNDGDWLELSVRDTGIGIDAVFLQKLFVEFAQEDSSATRRFGGTGLGLTICQKLCDMMGGDISVESTVGVGTTFTVRLPAIPGRYTQPEVISSRAEMS